MPVNWTLYETVLGNGARSDRRNITIGESVNAFASSIIDDPAYQADALVAGVVTPIVASRKSTISCSIKAVPETNIHIGDLVDCLGQCWIVVELYADKLGLLNGTMWLCNNVIRFQNRTSEIIERNCVIDDGTYSKRSSDPDAYVMANTYQIYMPIDDDTRRLFVDKRLAFGKVFSSSGEEILEVYKVVGMDLKSKNFGDGSHLMVLTMQRDVYNPQTDSLSENICDMVTETNNATAAISGNCNITGRDTIRIGASRSFTAIFMTSSGEENREAVPIWDVSAPNGVLCDGNGAKIKITVPLSEDLVGEVITITLSDSDGAYGKCEKKVQVTTVG